MDGLCHMTQSRRTYTFIPVSLVIGGIERNIIIKSGNHLAFNYLSFELTFRWERVLSCFIGIVGQKKKRKKTKEKKRVGL